MSYQTVNNELGQLVEIPLGSIVILGWNVDDWPSSAVTVLQYTSLVDVFQDCWRIAKRFYAVLFAPFIRF